MGLGVEESRGPAPILGNVIGVWEDEEAGQTDSR